MRKVMIVLGLCLLACSGVVPAVEVAPVAATPVAPAGPCCTVDDVIRLTGEGVDKQVIVDTLKTSGVDLVLTADDLSRLSAAAVDPEVIAVLNGGPCECTCRPPEVVAAAHGAPAADAPPPLNVTVKYGGGGSFELVNLSTREYTGLKLVANGEYQYRLKKLPANSSDAIRLSSFVSTSDGSALKGGMTSLYVTSDQGAWSKTF